MSDQDPVAADSAAAPVLRPGQQLAAARVGNGLSALEVAQQLKLSVSQIEALEAGDYARLPGAVFVRGFVRNYARIVGLDGEGLVAALELPASAATATAAVPHSHNIPFPERKPVSWPRHAALLAVLVVALAAYHWYPDSPDGAVVAPEAPRVVAAPALVVVPPVPVAAAPAEPAFVAQPAEPANPATALPAAPPTVAVPAVVPPPPEPVRPAATAVDAAPAKVAEPPAVPARQPGMAELQFRFATESWVEVRDRSERVLFSQLNPAGSQHALQARPPLTVVVGNATGVKISYNGKPFDLAPHTRVEVARFTLD